MKIENHNIYYTEQLMPIEFVDIQGDLSTYVQVKDMISWKMLNPLNIGKVLYKEEENKINIVAGLKEELIFDSNLNIIRLVQHDNKMFAATYINEHFMFLHEVAYYNTSNTISVYKLKTEVENEYIAPIIPNQNIIKNKIILKLKKLCLKLYN